MSSTSPNKQNSGYKLWIALSNGENINMFSFPEEEKRLKRANKVFASMYERVVVKKNLLPRLNCAIFYNVKTGERIYTVNSGGNVRRVGNY